MQKLSSGEIAPKTGEYNVVSANGKRVGVVRVKKGDRMPPTQSANNHFEIE
ncbi:MAG: hypothetical protein K2L51_04125 [Clostridiales bacterium]|nr:hypothetical protein [Clostridiales bacterium]